MMSAMNARKADLTPLSTEFAGPAVDQLTKTQTALRQLIRSIPGVTRRPKDLEKTLGISASLAWQIHKFAHANDPLSEIRILPGPMAIKRFLDAASARGASASVIASVRAALDNVEHLIARHAENRREFKSLLSGLTQDGAEAVDHKSRRAILEGQSHVLGYRADTNLCCFVSNPSREDPLKMDSMVIRTITGIRRFREDVSIVVAEARSWYEDGSAYGTGPRPLVDDPTGEGPGLIPEFCTQPLPIVKRVITSKDTPSLIVQPRGLGVESAIICSVGCLWPRINRYRTAYDRHATSQSAVRTPCKLLIHDLLVYRGLFEPLEPEVMIYTDHRGVDAAPVNRDCDRLPTHDRAVFMGAGIDVLKVDEIPYYQDLLRFALGRVGWKIDDFDVYRVRIEYPLMPSSVFTQFELREPPGA
jgi:hypothetical protein